MSDQDKRPELPEPLPCPFCGGKAQLCTNHWPGRADMHWVQCVNENCCGHPGGGLAHGVAMGILAVVAWNKRELADDRAATDKRPELPTPNNLGHYNTAELLAYGAACEAYGRASVEVTDAMVEAARAAYAEATGRTIANSQQDDGVFRWAMHAALTAALRAREG